MGRRRIDRHYEAAVKAIQEAMQDTRFQERFDVLRSSLRAHGENRLQAQENGDPSAAYADWNWRNVKLDQGRVTYSGPYYEIRELCDVFALPWPESYEIVFRLASDLSSPELPQMPSEQAWQAWRMAGTGLRRPRPDEVAQARNLLGDYTPHGRRRRFNWGLTQDAVAHILNVDERTVRQWIGDCRRYAQVGNLNEIAEAARLTGGELVMLVVTRLMEEKPEE